MWFSAAPQVTYIAYYFVRLNNLLQHSEFKQQCFVERAVVEFYCSKITLPNACIRSQSDKSTLVTTMLIHSDQISQSIEWSSLNSMEQIHSSYPLHSVFSLIL